MAGLNCELRQAVLDVEARAAGLRAGLAPEVQARRTEAAAERLVSGDTKGLLSALPLAARSDPRRVGRWLHEPADPEGVFGGRVLVDGSGRPLLHERLQDGYLLAVWRYDEDRTEEVRFWGDQSHVTWVLHPGGGRPLEAVGADLSDRWAERWSWRHDQVVRVDRGSAAPESWASAHATEAELDAEGQVVVLLGGHEHRDIRDDNRLGHDAWLAAMGDALDRASTLVCDRVGWRTALDAPAELPADLSGLAERLAEAFAEAMAAAAVASGLGAPFCVQVRGGRDERPLLPPFALLADERWRQGLAAKGTEKLAAIRDLWRGEKTGAVVDLDLLPHLGQTALRGCAALNGALSTYADPAERARAEPVLAELADRLTVRLGERGRFSGATADFLPLVHLGDVDERESAALERAERTLGAKRVAAFTESLRSKAPGRGGIPAKVVRRARWPKWGCACAPPPEAAEALASAARRCCRRASPGPPAGTAGR